MNRPLIIAHRGDSAHAPENTLSAFKMAVEKGAEGIEFDVQLSKDGVPVVIHDHDLRRTAAKARLVSDMSAKQLSETDVGSWFNTKFPELARPEFHRQTIPALTEVLEYLAESSGKIYVELKCDGSTFKSLAAAVCDVIRDSPLLPRIIVKSFKLAAIPEVRHLLSDVQTAALFEPSILKILRSRRYMITMAREFGADQLSLHHWLATPKLCYLAAEANMPMTVWTVDDPMWVERGRKLGIGSLITNDPAALIEFRDR